MERLFLSNEKRSEPFNFKVLDKPICNIATSFIEISKKSPGLLEGLLAGICNVAYETYKVICFLVYETNKTRYPLQAQILLRSIIDILFTVVYLLDKPNENTKEFNLNGFRMMQIDYSKHLHLYEKDTDKQEYLINFQLWLDSTADFFQLSKEERENVKGDKTFWPLPRIIKNRLSIEKDKLFFQKVYDEHYGALSDLSHVTMKAVATSVYATLSTSEKWHPGQAESDSVLLAIEFLIMIFSEIQSKIDFKMESDLRYVWTLLLNIREECREYYSLRYDEILKTTRETRT